MKLYEEQMGIYEVLNTRQDLLVIEDFAILKKPYNKKKAVYIKTIIIFSAIGFALAILVGIFREALRLVKDQ